MFQGLFLELLPIEMRDHLVAHDFKSVEIISQHADRLWDTRRSHPTVNTATSLDQHMTALNRQASPNRQNRPQSPSQQRQKCEQTPGPIKPCFYLRFNLLPDYVPPAAPPGSYLTTWPRQQGQPPRAPQEPTTIVSSPEEVKVQPPSGLCTSMLRPSAPSLRGGG